MPAETKNVPIELLNHEGKNYLKVNLKDLAADFEPQHCGPTDAGLLVFSLGAVGGNTENFMNGVGGAYARFLTFDAAIEINGEVKYFNAGDVILNDSKSYKLGRSKDYPKIISKQEFLENYGDWAKHTEQFEEKREATPIVRGAKFYDIPMEFKSYAQDPGSAQLIGHDAESKFTHHPIVFKDADLRGEYVNAIQSHAITHTLSKSRDGHLWIPTSTGHYTR